MKNIKFYLLMAMVMTMSLTMSADDDDRVITYQQLPQTAQTFLKQHFAKKVPLVVTADWDDYTVVYESGEKVEFDKKATGKRLSAARPKCLLTWCPSKSSLTFSRITRARAWSSWTAIAASMR